MPFVYLDVCSLFLVYESLLALVSVLSQSFFTLVSRHFMTLMLLSVWHSGKILWINTLFILLFLHVHCESLCRLERGDVVLRNNDGSVL